MSAVTVYTVPVGTWFPLPNACDFDFERDNRPRRMVMESDYAKLAAALIEARVERDRLDVLIGDTGNHWLALTNDIRIPWEGAIDEAMRAACDKIRELTTESDVLRTQLAAERVVADEEVDRFVEAYDIAAVASMRARCSPRIVRDALTAALTPEAL